MTKLLQTLKSLGGRRDQKRVGRGGKRGKTAGRGTKGQNSRAGHKKRPELRDMIKKLPKRRGYGKNRARTVFADRPDAFPLSLVSIETLFDAGATVSPQTLAALGVIKISGRVVPRVKILGKDGITKAVKVEGCEFSVGAKAAIEKVGGTIAA
jgi:large subunit ribosomal protein L15